MNVQSVAKETTQHRGSSFITSDNLETSMMVRKFHNSLRNLSLDIRTAARDRNGGGGGILKEPTSSSFYSVDHHVVHYILLISKVWSQYSIFFLLHVSQFLVIKIIKISVHPGWTPCTLFYHLIANRKWKTFSRFSSIKEL